MTSRKIAIKEKILNSYRNKIDFWSNDKLINKYFKFRFNFKERTNKIVFEYIDVNDESMVIYALLLNNETELIEMLNKFLAFLE